MGDTPVTRCPVCEQIVPKERTKVEFGADGLIDAASLIHGLGPPIVDHQSCRDYHILLDGKEMDEVVAFDRREGLLWRHQKDSAGHLIIRENKVVVEKLKGTVTVELKAKVSSTNGGK
jgi:hypothetical protein